MRDARSSLHLYRTHFTALRVRATDLGDTIRDLRTEDTGLTVVIIRRIATEIDPQGTTIVTESDHVAGIGSVITAAMISTTTIDTVAERGSVQGETLNEKGKGSVVARSIPNRAAGS